MDVWRNLNELNVWTPQIYWKAVTYIWNEIYIIYFQVTYFIDFLLIYGKVVYNHIIIITDIVANICNYNPFK